MHCLFANFVRILDVCKQYSEDLLSDKDNMPRCGVIPKFSDLEVIAAARGKKAIRQALYLLHVQALINKTGCHIDSLFY